MENIYRWTLAFSGFFALAVSCNEREDYSQLIEGHWYVLYGKSVDQYGEAVYHKGKVCFYSENFGLRFREYEVDKNGVIRIYDCGEVEDQSNWHLLIL